MSPTLRPWNINDLDDLVRYANNFEISRFLMNKFPFPYTREAGEKFITFATKEDPPHVLAIEIDGHAIGGIGIHPLDDVSCKNAELGYWLAEPWWGKGIISAAVPQMLEYGFKTFEINRIFARPFGSNKASQRVLEKTGFTLEAKFDKTFFKNGIYEDEWVYAVRRNG